MLTLCMLKLCRKLLSLMYWGSGQYWMACFNYCLSMALLTACIPWTRCLMTCLYQTRSASRIRVVIGRVNFDGSLACMAPPPTVCWAQVSRPIIVLSACQTNLEYADPVGHTLQNDTESKFKSLCMDTNPQDVVKLCWVQKVSTRSAD